jgi:hypothetical protein
MHKELKSQLVNEVKAKVPKVDLSAEDIILITTTTLYTMGRFSAKEAEHKRARYLRGAGDLVLKLTSD